MARSWVRWFTLQTSFHYWSMMVGMMLIFIALFMPRGIDGVIKALLDRRGRTADKELGGARAGWLIRVRA